MPLPKRHRIRGRLEFHERAGPRLVEGSGMAWFLDVDELPADLIGAAVIVDGRRSGLTRLEVDYLGLADPQRNLS